MYFKPRDARNAFVCFLLILFGVLFFGIAIGVGMS